MPHSTKEKRNKYVHEKRKADPEWHEKQKLYYKNYYINHRRAILGWKREYAKKQILTPEQRRERKNAAKRYYYSKKSKTPEYNRHCREYGKKYREKLRDAILSAYGSKCACCGEAHREFLTIDHINGGGGRHLKRRGICGIYLDIIRAGFPTETYRILCMNCNFAFGQLGRCPHGDKDKQ